MNFAQADTAYFPAFPEASQTLTGPLPAKEYFVRLPEHVRFLPGGTFEALFEASPLLMEDVSTITFLFNDQPLTSFRLPGVGPQQVSTPITLANLRTGWNKISIRCLLQTTSTPCRDVDNPAVWLRLEQGTGLRLPYERRLLFPELGRFPETLTEEQLLRQNEMIEGFPDKDKQPLLRLLLPENCIDGELRAWVIAAARLGQPGYVSGEVVLAGKVEEWNLQSGETNGVLVGLTSRWQGVDLPVETRAALAALRPGEGLLAEIITGELPGPQRRWILVSGVDVEGLEKAALALGSADALETAIANPWVIQEKPIVTEFTAQLAQPLAVPQTLKMLHGGNLMLRGVFRSQSGLSWALPPGYEVAAGSKFLLEFTHAGGLSRESALQFTLNDTALPGVSLESEQNAVRTVSVRIPRGLMGRDPNAFLIQAYLDIGATDCAHRNEERAWVDFESSSALDIKARPVDIAGLDRLGVLLLRDAFLRRAAILLPRETPAASMEVLKSVSLHLGRQLPSMPILWPEAAFYSSATPPPSKVIEGRSVLLLGSAGQWRQGLPSNARLAIEELHPGGKLRLQNRESPVSDFPSTLVFAQFLVSPWNSNEAVIAVGGVRDLGGEVAVDLLTNPAVQARLAGSTAGVDRKGRIFTYDIRTNERDSLLDRVATQVPIGLTAEETDEKLEQLADMKRHLSLRNMLIAAVVLALVLILVRTQMRLMAKKARLRREALKDELPEER